MKLKDLKEDINIGGFGAIPKEVLEYAEKKAESTTRFCTWIRSHEYADCVIFRIFAFRKRKNKKLELTEVLRRVPGIKGEVCRNMWYTTMSGYHVCYKPESHNSWYSYNYIDKSDFNRWFEDDKRAGIWAPVINEDDIFRYPDYKYCGYSGKQDLLTYLELYDKEPMVEFFGKAGLIATKTLISLAKKDKQFAKFMRQNVEDCNKFGPQTSIYAYKNNMTICEAYDYLCLKRSAESNTRRCEGIQTTNVNRIKLWKYIKENNISAYSYADYWEAIRYLGLDINDTKNVYPKDFQRIHDLRINQYHSQVAAADLEARKDLNKQFCKVADKYRAFEYNGEKYVIILPDNITSLTAEGDALHHCVGKMGYDKKMAREETIIAFVRKKEDRTTPFVTIEYKPHGSILQCYGDHDSNPGQEVKRFCDKWASMVNKQLQSV